MSLPGFPAFFLCHSCARLCLLIIACTKEPETCKKDRVPAEPTVSLILTHRLHCVLAGCGAPKCNLGPSGKPALHTNSPWLSACCSAVLQACWALQDRPTTQQPTQLWMLLQQLTMLWASAQPASDGALGQVKAQKQPVFVTRSLTVHVTHLCYAWLLVFVAGLASCICSCQAA